MEVGTLNELGVEVGDVVEYGGSMDYYTVESGKKLMSHQTNISSYYIPWDTGDNFRIISRAKDKPKLWRDMTPEEKGALLLAAHEDLRCIEIFKGGLWVLCGKSSWQNENAYRIKPQPKIDTVVMSYQSSQNSMSVYTYRDDTHRITFQTIDGKPDCASIKMEEL